MQPEFLEWENLEEINLSGNKFPKLPEGKSLVY
jgi:hypothetical protein